MEHSQGLKELYDRVIGPGHCAACGACVGNCPYLVTFKGKTVKLHECTVEHGRCFSYCPMTTFDAAATSLDVFGVPVEDTPLGHVEQVIATRAADDEVAAAGQGGGTVTALMLMALQDRTIDAAVLTSWSSGEAFPKGIVATTPQEIRSCAGSRYVGAHSLSALREALNAGYEKIGVVGVPCQIRSLRKMGLLDLKRENLKQRICLSVGLFCNWAFSGRDFNRYLSERFGLNDVRRFHVPPPPAKVLEVETNRGLESISLDELRPFIQAACGQCSDLTSEFADVSVGMYEGRPGWNTVIARTAVGGRFIDTARQRGTILTEKFPQERLDHLKEASTGKRTRAEHA